MTPTLRELGIDGLERRSVWPSRNNCGTASVEELSHQPLTPAQRDELRRRIALADADPSRGVSWETVRAEARAR